MSRKFSEGDKRYKETRMRYSEATGPRDLWSVADHWPLFTGLGNLARYMAIADLLRESLEVPGDIAEFGVWRGATTMFFAKLLAIWDPHGPKTIHAFDSFEGLTEFTPPDGEAANNVAAYKGNKEELVAMCDLYELDGAIVLHEGLIEETLPPFLEAQPAQSFSFVYCDTDLYQSTSLILDAVHPRMMPGGLIVLDEWNMADYPGEGVAANEFLGKHSTDYRVRSVRNARQPTLVLQRIAGSANFDRKL